ncbi:MAG: hypothetical protein IPK26_02910 [Planctomycetes bacterium]|nr:hypothetical protein [Planctomycetota bacterium]
MTAISQRAARDEVHREAMARLQQLPEDERRLLACIGIEGMSHAETATLLGIAEDACRKRWQRLRERLQNDEQLRRLLA